MITLFSITLFNIKTKINTLFNLAGKSAKSSLYEVAPSTAAKTLAELHKQYLSKEVSDSREACMRLISRLFLEENSWASISQTCADNFMENESKSRQAAAVKADVAGFMKKYCLRHDSEIYHPLFRYYHDVFTQYRHKGITREQLKELCTHPEARDIIRYGVFICEVPESLSSQRQLYIHALRGLGNVLNIPEWYPLLN